MKLSAKSREPSYGPTIEPLEERIAPASVFVYTDANGDTVQVTASKGKLKAADFVFNVPSGNQQLEELKLTSSAFSGANITVAIQQAAHAGDRVNVGFIDAGGVNLGSVAVQGDLGRIYAGAVVPSSHALQSLTIQSLGADGLTTQAAGGDLNSRISGGVGSIIVNGDVDGASIGIGGGVKGFLGTLTITGSINGGTDIFSGSVRTQGGIGQVTVDGSITGNIGADSGIIGTAGALGPVIVQGSVVGGGGPFSGAILSSKTMHSVSIGGDLDGGAGTDSGQVGTASDLLAVTIGGSVNGGAGALSGVILATGNLPSVTITGSLTGGGGAGSGQVGAGVDIGTVTIGVAMSGGAEIHAIRNIGSVAVSFGGEEEIALRPVQTQDVSSPGIFNSIIQADTGSIGSVSAATIVYSGVNAGGNIGPINGGAGITGSVFVAGIGLGPAFNTIGAGSFGTGATFGFGSGKSTIAAHIGDITAGAITTSTFLAGVHGPGADGIFGTKDDSVATGSSIGNISSPGVLDTIFVESGSIGATNSDTIARTTYIATDTATSAGGIGPITVNAGDQVIEIGSSESLLVFEALEGIYGSTFTSNAGIGNVTVTLNGARIAGPDAGISSTTFQAGHALGAIMVTDNLSGAGGSNYGIADSTFNGGLEGYGGSGDITVALTDTGVDGNSAAIIGCKFDASVCACMSANMGGISAENADGASTAAGIVDCVFRVHGSIGPISATMDNGLAMAAAIEGTVFSAFGSIGDINVYGAVVPDSNGVRSQFLAGYDIGTSMSFGGQDLSATSLALNAGQSVGNVTVTGYFLGSDIIASINPGPEYIFGGNDNTNVGSGGSIGVVQIGVNFPLDGGTPFAPDAAAPDGIEAANFALSGESSVPFVTAFGVTADVPVLLLGPDGSGNVRITNLTQADT